MVDAILDATLRILQREGARRLTMTRVAEVAGISPGSLYQYFPHRPALLAATVERHVGRVTASVIERARALGGRPLSEAVPVALAEYLANKAALHEETRALREVMADEARLVIARAALEQVVAALAELIARAPDRRRRDPALTAFLLACAVEAAVDRTLEAAPERIADPEFRAALHELALGFVRADATPR